MGGLRTMTKKEFLERLDRVVYLAQRGYLTISEANDNMLSDVRLYTMGNWTSDTIKAYHAAYVRLARLTQDKK